MGFFSGIVFEYPGKGSEAKNQGQLKRGHTLRVKWVHVCMDPRINEPDGTKGSEPEWANVCNG